MTFQRENLTGIIRDGILHLLRLEFIIKYGQPPAADVQFPEPLLAPGSPTLTRIADAILRYLVSARPVVPRGLKYGDGLCYEGEIISKDQAHPALNAEHEPALLAFQGSESVSFLLKSRFHNQYSVQNVDGRYARGAYKQLKLDEYLIAIPYGQSICRITRVVTCSAAYTERFHHPSERDTETDAQRICRRRDDKIYEDVAHCSAEVKRLIKFLERESYSKVVFSSFAPMPGLPAKRCLYFKPFFGIHAFTREFAFIPKVTAISTMGDRVFASLHYLSCCNTFFNKQGFVGDQWYSNVLLSIDRTCRRVYLPIDCSDYQFSCVTLFARELCEAPTTPSLLIHDLVEFADEGFAIFMASYHAKRERYRQGILKRIPIEPGLLQPSQTRKSVIASLAMHFTVIGIAMNVCAFLFHDKMCYALVQELLWQQVWNQSEPKLTQSLQFPYTADLAVVLLIKDIGDPLLILFVKEFIDRAYVHGFPSWQIFLGNLVHFMENMNVSWKFDASRNYRTSDASYCFPAPLTYISIDMSEAAVQQRQQFSDSHFEQHRDFLRDICRSHQDLVDQCIVIPPSTVKV